MLQLFSRFNSILVRLKVQKWSGAKYSPMFQFHTGSIKRLSESQIYIIQTLIGRVKLILIVLIF